ncbi:ROK family protein [Mucilaginibacter aquatilis]|uniref:ROK family protein n=1 Tax=Mucilaginibacter aquatilis TaxID=1517760 RepID=A0A6I4IEN4_9SPHI|nr:ROK family protein [Mucilaginibacter aquatilis]MVN91829.1 ROK family protein [Mucilaginibacter aquatilis]
MSKVEGYIKNMIKELYFGQALSCTDISRRTNKSLPVTTKLLNDCIEEGFVFETGYAPSTGGRRAQTYSLKSDVIYIVSVAMDQLVTRLVIMDGQNNNVTDVRKLDLALKQGQEGLLVLTDAISQLIKDSGVSKEKIVGIGIGMPGFVDIAKGINHTFLNNDGQSITSYIKKATGLPVFLDNDSSLIALAEQKFGHAQDQQNVMVINIGWGIGLGMLINGNLFRGDNGLAGEFSHIPVFINNKLCSCGKTGCLETEASMLLIVEKAKSEIEGGRMSMLTQMNLESTENAANAIMSAALKGDTFAVELFSEAGYNIGRGAAILIHLLNPKLIVLSGRGAAADKLWLAPVQQAINEHCIPKIAEHTEVKISTLGYQAELIGAAALVMEHYNEINHHIQGLRKPILN